jgi:hypothetical protein
MVLAGSAWWGWRQARGAVAPADDPFGEQLQVAPEPDPYARVEVLNGAGEPGAARRAAEVLRRAGFDVVHFGNAPDFGVTRTRVIDRVGSGPRADSVAGWLGVDRTETEPDLQAHLDATIILGADWRDRFRLAGDSVGQGEGPDR